MADDTLVTPPTIRSSNVSQGPKPSWLKSHAGLAIGGVIALGIGAYVLLKSRSTASSTTTGTTTTTTDDSSGDQFNALATALGSLSSNTEALQQQIDQVINGNAAAGSGSGSSGSGSSSGTGTGNTGSGTSTTGGTLSGSGAPYGPGVDPASYASFLSNVAAGDAALFSGGGGSDSSGGYSTTPAGGGPQNWELAMADNPTMYYGDTQQGFVNAVSALQAQAVAAGDYFSPTTEASLQAAASDAGGSYTPAQIAGAANSLKTGAVSPVDIPTVARP